LAESLCLLPLLRHHRLVFIDEWEVGSGIEPYRT
jgi:hypothetical protein